MGLDMYLMGERYLSKYGSDEEQKILKKLNTLTKTIRNDWEIKEIFFEVAYWRKANSIHNWFVNNIQKGVDDCGKYRVDLPDFEKLYDIVTTVLEDHTKAEELLPTKSGFFFGDTEYNEFYFDDLKYTKKVLTPIIEGMKNNDPNYMIDYYYESSW